MTLQVLALPEQPLNFLFGSKCAMPGPCVCTYCQPTVIHVLKSRCFEDHDHAGYLASLSAKAAARCCTTDFRSAIKTGDPQPRCPEDPGVELKRCLTAFLPTQGHIEETQFLDSEPSKASLQTSCGLRTRAGSAAQLPSFLPRGLRKVIEFPLVRGGIKWGSTCAHTAQLLLRFGLPRYVPCCT